MDIVLLAMRLLLGGIFLIAGFTKLVDRPGARETIKAFGLPAKIATPVAVILPLTELVGAGLLLSVDTAWWGALGVLALLLLFSVGIGINLALGRRPDCHCFGQLASSPIGWPTLARNVILAVIAGLILWLGRDGTGASITAWVEVLTVAETVAVLNGTLALALGAITLWLLVQLLGQNGRLLVRLDALEGQFAALPGLAVPYNPGSAAAPPAGLPVGAAAPTFGLSGLFGEMLTLDSLRTAGRPVLLVFTDPNCGVCTELLPDIARWQRELAATLTLAIISRGSADENRVKGAQHGLTQILLQQDNEVAERYQANGTPSAVLVRTDGSIGSPLARGAQELRVLLAHVAGVPGPLAGQMPPALLSASGNTPCPHCGRFHGNGGGSLPVGPTAAQIGQPAPALKLPDLTGDIVDLVNFRGSETILLFWNPHCGFCQQMISELRAWEGEALPGAPMVLIVSSGTVEAHQALGLQSRVVLQSDLSAMHAFGATGTPSAVLIDREGRVASPVVAGAPDVLVLIRRKDQSDPLT